MLSFGSIHYQEVVCDYEVIETSTEFFQCFFFLHRDAVLFACANSGTSIYAGFVIFSVIGFMAGNQNKDISEVAASGIY